MASKKYDELKAMNDADLQTELRESESFIQKLRFDHAVKGLDNPMVLKSARRDVARIHTEIRRREIAAMDQEQLANRSKLRRRRK